MNQDKTLFYEQVQELKPIRRYEILCQCVDCENALYPDRKSTIIEGFDLDIQNAWEVFTATGNGKYPMSYINGKFIHSSCINQTFDPQDIIAETLGRLAFYRLANDDTDFCLEVKQFMKEVKHRNFLTTEDSEIDTLTGDDILKSLYALYKPYGGNK